MLILRLTDSHCTNIMFYTMDKWPKHDVKSFMSQTRLTSLGSGLTVIQTVSLCSFVYLLYQVFCKIKGPSQWLNASVTQQLHRLDKEAGEYASIISLHNLRFQAYLQYVSIAFRHHSWIIWNKNSLKCCIFFLYVCCLVSQDYKSFNKVLILEQERKFEW